MRLYRITLFVITLIFFSSTLCFSQWIDKKDGYRDPDAKKDKVPTNLDKQRRSTKEKVPQRVTKRRRREPPPPPNGAVIEFEHDVFDYGAVPFNSRLSHFYEISNSGPDSLVISKFKPT